MAQEITQIEFFRGIEDWDFKNRVNRFLANPEYAIDDIVPFVTEEGWVTIMVRYRIKTVGADE